MRPIDQVVTDPLPAGVRFGGWVEQATAQLPPPAGSGSLVGQLVYWGPHDVPSGASFALAFTATVAPDAAFAGGVVSNTAWFSSTNVGAGFDSASFSVKFMDLYLPLMMKSQF